MHYKLFFKYISTKCIFYLFFTAAVKSTERSLFGWRGARGGSLSPAIKMAAPLGILRDCTHPSLNDSLKSHSNVTFKLVKTGMLFYFFIVGTYNIYFYSIYKTLLFIFDKTKNVIR